MDTGSNKNYIQSGLVKNAKENDNPFFANSVGGKIKITQHTFLNLFNLENCRLKFFLLPTLKTFHAILGNDSLKELSAVIHTRENFMVIANTKKIYLRQFSIQNVNTIHIRDEHPTTIGKDEISQLTQKHRNLFSEPNEKLTYTTKVVAEIRTISDTPIYSKSYPYPTSLRQEVEDQVNKLLEDGIIRKSRSPYNSPVWIVPKKNDTSGKKKFRMVIDYRKLNTVTIADRYPIPEINEVLSQLGENRIFSVIDLKSGFHQIPLKESDVEKTAFSVNNGKYEFTRLPFGLKNAPSIFQRTLDDILREHIGRICYVYIDDIIIFSKDEKEHSEHIDTIFDTLTKANMKVQVDKCEFFKKQVEFLGFVVSSDGISTNPSKVQAIANFHYPQTIKDLRSFLGLSGYYRRFIKDYAKLAKPLTSLLRGEEGRMSKSSSKKIQIQLNEEAKAAFNKIKNTLISKDVILQYPDYSKEFNLTTDASKYAIGAVLEQNGKPITFISRTLNKAEENYAVNEKEMLAIIWALNSFRNYLYGAAKVVIHTDHQPLTYALSNKNNNSKLKRWKAILEEYNYELRYKPGKSNVVADTLSRPFELNSLSVATHSDESSSHNLIPSVEGPINAFKNQLWISLGEEDSYQFKIPFPTYHRHLITKPNFSMNNLVALLKRYLNPSVINGIITSEEIMGKIQEVYPQHFSNYKIRYTQTKVEDLINEDAQNEEILKEHKRAHRNRDENKKQLIQIVYFPKMKAKIENIIKQCKVCKEHKYNRHPNKPKLLETPIPQYPGEIVHIDIYTTEKHLVLTALDKFSKYAQVKLIRSKAIEDIREPLREIIFSFGVPKTIVIDNEKSLNSASIQFMVEDQLGIEVFKTPPYTSTVNGQVERFHSTLSEIMRCLKTEQTHRSFQELLDRSTYEYNYSIHSATGKRPIETFFGRRVSIDPEQYENSRRENINILRKRQAKDLETHNKTRQPIKTYSPGDIIYVRINKRLGSKLTARYREEIVKEDKSSVVITEKGRTVHKSNIKT